MITTLVVLAFLGLAMGSFVSALVWRIHKKKDWVRARSQCPHCKHKLSPADLIPVFSWLLLGGRCRYCKKPISWQYPAIELGMAAIFVASYAFWPGGVEGAGDWLLFVGWLTVSIGLMALLVYDARYMLLPNKILYPTLLVAVVTRLVYLVGFESDKPQALMQWILGLAVASGIFWLLYGISKGQWIGFGDVRLGLITGTVLASPAQSFLMILVASVLGVVFVLPAMVSGNKSLASKIPYGPFLIVGAVISLLFGDSLIDWYEELFIP